MVDFAELVESQDRKIPLHIIPNRKASRKLSSLGLTENKNHIATLSIIVNSTPVKELVVDDGISLMSGISGLTGSGNILEHDQDLNGFEESRRSLSISSSIGRASHSNVGEAELAEIDDRLEEEKRNESLLAGSNTGKEPRHRSNRSTVEPRGPPLERNSVNQSMGGVDSPVEPEQKAGSRLRDIDDRYEGADETEDQELGIESEGQWGVSHPDDFSSTLPRSIAVVGGAGRGGDEVATDVDEALLAERYRAEQAEALLEEALSMVEDEREALKQAEASIAQLKHDVEWSERKFAKEKASWEARTKDAFEKMEQTVILTERVQAEKNELKEELARLLEENEKMKTLIDRESVEAQINEAAENARLEAKNAADIEMNALKDRLREMNEFVEESDAKALRATARAAALQAQLDGGSSAGGSAGAGSSSGLRAGPGIVISSESGMRASPNTTLGGDDEVSLAELREAEERADALSLELEYAKATLQRLETELDASKQEAELTIAMARRDAEVQAARAAELMRQLDDAWESSATSEIKYSQAQSRIVMLEDAVERSNIQTTELQQRLMASELMLNQSATFDSPASVSNVGRAPEDPTEGSIRSNDANDETSPSGYRSWATDPTPSHRSEIPIELQMAMRQLREVQDAAEVRAAQLASVSRDLASSQEELISLKKELRIAQEEASCAQQMLFAREEEIKELKREMKTRAWDRETIARLQEEMSSLLIATSADRSMQGKEESSTRRTGSVDARMNAGSHENQLGAERRPEHVEQHPSMDADVDAWRDRVGQAEHLAGKAAQQAADLIVQLATAKTEALESSTKLSELRSEVAKLRSGKDAELWKRIESLEHDLVVARNRADVNALFRDEHDRLAGELVQSKLALAEAQEEILVLRRERFKADERNMSFASKLTSLEAKLYQRLSSPVTNLASRRRRSSSRLGKDSTENSRPPSQAEENVA